MGYKFIDDKAIIKGICKKYNLKRDRTFNYIVQDNNLGEYTPLEYEGKIYMLKYFSGCFYPYLAEKLPNTV